MQVYTYASPVPYMWSGWTSDRNYIDSILAQNAENIHSDLHIAPIRNYLLFREAAAIALAEVLRMPVYEVEHTIVELRALLVHDGPYLSILPMHDDYDNFILAWRHKSGSFCVVAASQRQVWLEDLKEFLEAQRYSFPEDLPDDD